MIAGLRGAGPSCCYVAGCIRPTDGAALGGSQRWICLCTACKRATVVVASVIALLQHGEALSGNRFTRDDRYNLKEAALLDSLGRPPLVSVRSSDKDGRAEQDRGKAGGGERNGTSTPRESTSTEGGLSYLFAIGESNTDNETLAALKIGAHEPNRNGIPLHLFTLSGQAKLGSEVEAHASVMARSMRGTAGTTEIEEAYVTVGEKRLGSQLKIGRFFTEFGQLNAEHFEDADFIDKPVVLVRLFGSDQLSNDGIRVRLPVDSRAQSTVIVGMQTADGETANSFLSEPGEEIGGHSLVERKTSKAKDLLYHLRWSGTFPANGKTFNAGVSVARGPNASGLHTTTTIYGVDLTAAWRVPGAAEGRPVLRWHTELLKRRYEAGDTGDPDREILKDWGLVTQALWTFRAGWTAGMRLDYANGNGDKSSGVDRDRRTRLSTNLTWQTGSAARWRLQVNRDSAHHLATPVNSIWFQLRLATAEDDARGNFQ